MSSDQTSRLRQQIFEVLPSPNFPAWLAEQRISIAFSTYQTGKIFFVGLKPEGRLSIFERTFNRCMGLWSDNQTLWLAMAFQLWRLENVLSDGEDTDGYDRLYVPRIGYTVGDIDVHDLSVQRDGRVVFVSSLFSCLATVSERHNFRPLWRPRFISKLAAEDRCHLNGLAMENGEARYVTACSQTDVAQGWREGRHDGGCVVDVTTDEVVIEGLSMPHSPRVYRDRLWLLDSGTGYFGYVDRARGCFEPVTFCPGYARGLTFIGDYAVVGVSKPRRERTFSGLALDRGLAQRGAGAQCGLQVIDLRTGDVRHWMQIEGMVEELYDVIVLPGVVRPKALGFKSDEIRYNVWLDLDGKIVRWSGQPKG